MEDRTFPPGALLSSILYSRTEKAERYEGHDVLMWCNLKSEQPGEVAERLKALPC